MCLFIWVYLIYLSVVTQWISGVSFSVWAPSCSILKERLGNIRCFPGIWLPAAEIWNKTEGLPGFWGLIWFYRSQVSGLCSNVQFRHKSKDLRAAWKRMKIRAFTQQAQVAWIRSNVMTSVWAEKIFFQSEHQCDLYRNLIRPWLHSW